MKLIKMFLVIGLCLVFSGLSALYATEQGQVDQSRFIKTGVYFIGDQFFELKADGTVIDNQGSVGKYEVQDGKLVNTYKNITDVYTSGVPTKLESVYSIAYSIKTGVLIQEDNNNSYKLWKVGSTREEYATHNEFWLTVRPGESGYGFVLDESKIVYLNSKFLFKFNRAEGMVLSPLSPSKRYRTVVSWDFDKGGIQLLIVDMQKEAIAASDGLNGGTARTYIPSFAHWLSWSPSESYALISPGGEGIRELMFIDLKTKLAKNVSMKRLGKEYKKGVKEMQITKIDSVKWIDNQKFSVQIALYCNHYDDNKCNLNKPLRTYEALVNIDTGKIDYKRLR